MYARTRLISGEMQPGPSVLSVFHIKALTNGDHWPQNFLVAEQPLSQGPSVPPFWIHFSLQVKGTCYLPGSHDFKYPKGLARGDWMFLPKTSCASRFTCIQSPLANNSVDWGCVSRQGATTMHVTERYNCKRETYVAKCSDQFGNRDLRFKWIPFFVRSIISGNKSSDVTWLSLLIDNSNLQSKIVKSSEFSRVIRQHFALEISR